MKQLFLVISAMTFSIISVAQSSLVSPEILYGTIRKEDLQATPYSKWFDSTYSSYKPNPDVIKGIKKIDNRGLSIQVFLGTWCGDSRREVPRFMNIMNQLTFPAEKIQLIAVGGTDSLYKQSPQQQEAGKGIFRVPVFIIYKNGKEINRINEFPAYSLEQDLYVIFREQAYTPNYRSFSTIRDWMANGTLTDKNINNRGLAAQIRFLVSGENELNSLGYLLLKQERKDEALRIFQVNAVLYPESANVISSLGEGYLRIEENKMAIQYLERALELNRDPLRVKEILKVLYEAKRRE